MEATQMEADDNTYTDERTDMEAADMEATRMEATEVEVEDTRSRADTRRSPVGAQTGASLIRATIEDAATGPALFRSLVAAAEAKIQEAAAAKAGAAIATAGSGIAAGTAATAAVGGIAAGATIAAVGGIAAGAAAVATVGATIAAAALCPTGAVGAPIVTIAPPAALPIVTNHPSSAAPPIETNDLSFAAPRKSTQGGHHEHKKPWTAEEDIKVAELVQAYGKRWALIAQRLPGRSIAMIRNRYQRIEAGRNAVESGHAKNKCHLCGQLKRGHTCTAGTIDVAGLGAWNSGVSGGLPVN